MSPLTEDEKEKPYQELSVQDPMTIPSSLQPEDDHTLLPYQGINIGTKKIEQFKHEPFEREGFFSSVPIAFEKNTLPVLKFLATPFGQPYIENEFLNHMFAQPEEGFVGLTKELSEQWDPIYWDQINDTVNSADRARLLENLKNNQAMAQKLEQAGWKGTAAGFVADLFNPLYWVPITAAARYATAGASVWKGIKGTVASSIVPTVLDTSIRYMDDATMTAEHAVIEAAASTAVMSAFGGVAGYSVYRLAALNKANLRAAFEGVDIMDVIGPKGEILETRAVANTVSGQEAVPYVQDLINEGIHGLPENGMLGKTWKLFTGQSALVKAYISDSPTLRKLGNNLAISKIITGNIAKGIPAPIKAEEVADTWQAIYNAMAKKNRDGYKDYLYAEKANIGTSTPPMRRAAFNQAVGISMRNGDTHANAAVDKMAKAWRKSLYDPLKEQMIKHGALDPDKEVQTAISYMTRLWDRASIIKSLSRKDGTSFLDVSEKWLKEVSQEVEQVRAPINEINAKIKEERFQMKAKKLGATELKRLLDEQVDLKLAKESEEIALGGNPVGALETDIRNLKREYSKNKNKQIRRARVEAKRKFYDKKAELQDTINKIKEEDANLEPIRKAITANKQAVKQGKKHQRQQMQATIKEQEAHIQGVEKDIQDLFEPGIDLKSRLNQAKKELRDAKKAVHPEKLSRETIERYQESIHFMESELALTEHTRDVLLKELSDPKLLKQDLKALKASMKEKLKEYDVKYDKRIEDMLNYFYAASSGVKHLIFQYANQRAHLKDLKEAASIKSLKNAYQKELKDKIKKLTGEKNRILNQPEYKKLKDIHTKIAQNFEKRKVNLKDEEKLIHDEKIIALEKQKEKLEEKILKDIESGKLPPHLLNRKGELRFPFRNEMDARLEAQQIMENILGTNDTQTMQDIMGTISSKGASTSASPLKQRVYLIPDNLVTDFLENDIEKLASIYSKQLGRIDGLYTMFKNLGYGDQSIDEAKESLASKINEDFNFLQRQILKSNKSEKVKAKELIKLDKKRTKDIRHANEMFQVYMGTYSISESSGARTVRSASQWIQQYNVITKLGNLAITILSDLASPAFKVGVGKWLKEGIIPVFSKLENLFQKGGALRQELADMHIAVEHSLVNRLERKWGEGFEYEPNNAFTSTTQRLASLSANLNGANIMDDLQTTVAASVMQSRFIRLSEEYLKNGSLSQKNIELLALAGFDYKKYGDVVVGQATKHGGTLNGGWISGQNKWDDDVFVQEASEHFSNALRRGVRLSLSKRSKFDNPIAFNDPVIQLFTQFMGWMFTAQNTFVIPFLQRPDAEKLSGITAMIALGSLSYPIKQALRGEEIDPDKIIPQAFLNSGFSLGWQIETVNKILTALDSPILRNLQNEKYGRLRRRGQSGLSILAGPAAGAVEDIVDVTGAAFSGEWNKRDAKTGAFMLPFTTNPLVAPGIRKWIDESTLPATRHQAIKQSQ